MKPRAAVLILLGSLVGLGLVLAVVFPDQSLRTPWEARVVLELPSFATQDRQGNVLVIDRSLSRIRKIGADGTLAFEISGSKREAGSLFSAVELAVDEAGFLYVLNQTMPQSGFYTEREDVLRYRPDGTFDRIVASRVYSPAEWGTSNVTRGHLTNLTVAEGEVRWFELGKAGILENTVDTETWRHRQTLVLSRPDAMVFVASVTRPNPSTLAFTTKQGVVFRQVQGSPPESVYSGDEVEASGLSVPWWVASDDQGGLYVSDLARSQILRLESAGAVPVFDGRSLNKAEERPPSVYYTFAVTPEGRLVTTNEDSVLVVEAGRVVSHLVGASVPAGLLVVRALTWTALAAGLWLMVLFLQWAHRYLFQRRISLIVKQLLVSLPLVTAFLVLVSWTLTENFSARLESQSFEQISQAIQLMARTIDTDKLDRLTKQSDFMNEDYRFIRDQLHSALNENKDPWNAQLYFALHRLREGQIYTTMYLNDGVGLFHPFTYLNDPSNLYRRALQGPIVTNKIPDAWGTWALGVGPVYNKQGKVSALLEVGRDLYGFQKQTEAQLWSLLPFVGLGFVVLIVLFVTATWFFLAPLRTLRSGVNRIARGQWETILPIRGSDEVADLTVGFNRMTSYIRNYIDEIVALSQSRPRSEEAPALTAESTLLYAAARSFGESGVNNSAQEDFDFLNRYLGLVSPRVRRNEGFVDRYIGNAILAVFPRSADDALAAALQILDQGVEFQVKSRQEGQEETKIGLCLFTGDMAWGSSGIDHVSLASRLEALTQFFDATLIVAESTYRALKDPHRYQFRSLGRVKLKGTQEPLVLFEALDGLAPRVKEGRLRSREAFEEGIARYQAKDFAGAEGPLQRALKLSPDDTAITVYLALCRRSLRTPPPGEWTGAIVMHSR